MHSEWLFHFLLWLIFTLRLLIQSLIYFYHFPAEWSHEEGQTQTCCLSAHPGGGNGVKTSWRQMEDLSRQTCERLCRTLCSSFTSSSHYFLWVCVCLRVWFITGKKYISSPTGSWIPYEENRRGCSQSTWMSSCSAEGDQFP